MIPNLIGEVEVVKRQHPEAWAHAHSGNARTEDFIRLLAIRLHAIDDRFGLNGKRGNPEDISDDVVNVLGEGPGRTPDGVPCTVIDVIAAAGSPAQRVQWAPFTNPQDSSGAWVRPSIPDRTTPITPPLHVCPPCPPVPPTFPYPDEGTAVLWFQHEVKIAYADAGRQFPDPNDSDAYRHFVRYGFSCRSMPEPDARRKHIAELRAQLGV